MNDVSGTVKQKRYDLYVDESGQDTRGEVFVVAVVAVENSEEFREYCKSLEKSSGKGKVKWRTAQKIRRLDYLRSIMLDSTSHKFKLFYNVFRKTKDYDAATIESIAKSIRVLRPSGSRVYVHVDGLSKTKRSNYKTRLRKFSCPVRKVSGIRRDENEPLIRLADAVAGASRDLLKYRDSELREILDLALQQGILVEL